MCAGCHPLVVERDGRRIDLPHRELEVAQSVLRKAGVEDAALLQETCAECHVIADGRIAPVNAPKRWYPGARFDHGKHSALAYMTPEFAQDRECRFCHVGALSSTTAATVSIPSAETCRQCHGKERSERCSTCHVFHEIGPAPVSSYKDASADTVAHGREQTRFGMRTCSAYWPIAAYMELPTRVWKRPEIKPGTPEFSAEIFERYGMFPADWDNDGLPVGLIKVGPLYKGEPGLVVTCELCHSSSLLGELVIGQPNPFSNMEQLFRDMNTAVGSRLRDPLYDRNPHKNTIVNGADQLGLVGLIIRQPDLALHVPLSLSIKANSSMELKPEFDQLAYVKTPPWYTYRTKLGGVAGYYHDGGHPKDGNFSAFTYLPAFHQPGGREVAKALADWMHGGHAFLASVEAPPYPFAVDASKVPGGRAIYEKSCARCHGHYVGEATADNLAYPGLVVGLDEIRTDPKRARFPAKFGVRMKAILRDEYVVTGGYVAPPLTSIWARAPYLHNGSVPTLRALFRPETRPKMWALTANPNRAEDFLEDDVGWRFEVTTDRDAYSRVFDPSVVDGLGNGGHDFAGDLSDDDVDALIEFLKTL